MSAEAHNFHKPVRLGSQIEQRIVRWMEDVCALVVERWTSHVPYPMEMSFQGCETARPYAACSELPEPGVGYRIALGSGDLESIVGMPRGLALILSAGVLGEVVRDNPEDRELTPVESSLYKMLMAAFNDGLRETWPGDEPLNFRLRQYESSVRRTRAFKSDENLVLNRFTLRGPFGDMDFFWLVPQQIIVDHLGRSGGLVARNRDSAKKQQLESLVHEMPANVLVRLGTAKLTSTQLRSLREGDVLVLDQRVREPLKSFVGGKLTFRVWPCRIGSQQAVQIVAAVKD